MTDYKGKDIHIHIHNGAARQNVGVKEVENYANPLEWKKRMEKFGQAEKNLATKAQKAWKKFTGLIGVGQTVPGAATRAIVLAIILIATTSLGFMVYLTVPPVQEWVNSKIPFWQGATGNAIPALPTEECGWKIEISKETGLPNVLGNGKEYTGPLIGTFPIQVCKDSEFDEWIGRQEAKIEGEPVYNGLALAATICLESNIVDAGCNLAVFEAFLSGVGENSFILPDKSLQYQEALEPTAIIQVPPSETNMPTSTPEAVPEVIPTEEVMQVITVDTLHKFLAEGNYTYALSTTRCPLEDEISMRAQRLDGSFKEIVVDVTNIKHNFIKEACNIEWAGVVFTPLQPLEAYPPDRVPQLKWWSYYPGNVWAWPFSIECQTFSWEDLQSVQITDIFRLAGNLRWESESSCFYLIDPPATFPISGYHVWWEMIPGKTFISPEWVSEGIQFTAEGKYTAETREADPYEGTFELRVPGREIFIYPLKPMPLEQSTPWVP